MPAARSPASIAIARHRAESAAPPMRNAPSDAWMIPAVTADPTYTDPAAAAKWLADVVAQGKARNQGKGRAATDVGRVSAEEAQPDVATPPETQGDRDG